MRTMKQLTTLALAMTLTASTLLAVEIDGKTIDFAGKKPPQICELGATTAKQIVGTEQAGKEQMAALRALTAAAATAIGEDQTGQLIDALMKSVIDQTTSVADATARAKAIARGLFDAFPGKVPTVALQRLACNIATLTPAAGHQAILRDFTAYCRVELGDAQSPDIFNAIMDGLVAAKLPNAGLRTAGAGVAQGILTDLDATTRRQLAQMLKTAAVKYIPAPAAVLRYAGQ